MITHLKSLFFSILTVTKTELRNSNVYIINKLKKITNGRFLLNVKKKKTTINFTDAQLPTGFDKLFVGYRFFFNTRS